MSVCRRSHVGIEPLEFISGQLAQALRIRPESEDRQAAGADAVVAFFRQGVLLDHLVGGMDVEQLLALRAARGDAALDGPALEHALARHAIGSVASKRGCERVAQGWHTRGCSNPASSIAPQSGQWYIPTAPCVSSGRSRHVGGTRSASS
jgi:hypothetical protein